MKVFLRKMIRYRFYLLFVVFLINCFLFLNFIMMKDGWGTLLSFISVLIFGYITNKNKSYS